MAKYQFGRRFSKDDRDKQFHLLRRLAPPGEVLPVKKLWKINSTALDQGKTGTCVAHAWCNFLRCEPDQTEEGIDQLRWEIYDRAILLDEFTDNDHDTDRQMGTTIRAGAKAVTELGRLKSYLWAFELQPALEWVLTQGPIVLGTRWYSSMMRPNKEGIIKIKRFSRVEGGHAYLWRGADTRRGLADCCNSWGDGWGDSGDFKLSFRDLERLIHEQGECCTAIEQVIRKEKV